jgi:hypothetical protein
VVSVAARNGVGLGPATSSASVVATPPAPGPLNAQASAAADGSVTVTWAVEPGDWSFTVTTSGGTRVATTGGTRAVISSLPPGTRVGFTVRGSEAQGGTVQATTDTVVPYTAASAPAGLGGSVVGENDHVDVQWSAPTNLGGGALVGYRVVSGGVTKTVTGTSTSVAADHVHGGAAVQVTALTKDPNSGRMLDGKTASRTIPYNAPPPDVALNQGKTSNGQLIIDYALNSHGVQSSCQLAYEGSSVFWTGTLADGNHRGVDIGPFDINNGTTIRLTCTTSGGEGDDPTVIGE